jgi:hypothetical protein
LERVAPHDSKELGAGGFWEMGSLRGDRFSILQSVAIIRDVCHLYEWAGYVLDISKQVHPDRDEVIGGGFGDPTLPRLGVQGDCEAGQSLPQFRVVEGTSERTEVAQCSLDISTRGEMTASVQLCRLFCHLGSFALSRLPGWRLSSQLGGVDEFR